MRTSAFLFKKTGEFELAADHIARSLEIKPEGHLNLGDYYLRMLRWLAANRNGQQTSSFLGSDYAAGPNATGEMATREHLLGMIRNAPEFADSYLLLGDLYFLENNSDADQLALRCYLRASDLSLRRDAYHSDIARSRVLNLYVRNGVVADHAEAAYSPYVDEVEEAEEWLSNYQMVEADLLAASEPIDVASVKVAMEQRGFAGLAFHNIGIEEGKPRSVVPILLIGVSIWIALAGAIIGMLWVIHLIRKRVRTRRRGAGAAVSAELEIMTPD